MDAHEQRAGGSAKMIPNTIKVHFLGSLLLAMIGIMSAAPFNPLSCVVFNRCNGGRFPINSASTISQDLNVALEALNDLSSSTGFGAANQNKFYAMYHCRGDIQVSNADCADCVAEAQKQAKSRCPNATGQTIQLDACYLRYEQYPFFELNTSQVVTFCTGYKNRDSAFQQNVASLLKTVIASAPANPFYYASASANGINALAQCLGYLSTSECAACLATNSNAWQACNNAVGAQAHSVSCFYRYETYAFFNA